MSHLPHIAQRHPWHQAVYALIALVSQEKALKQASVPQQKPAKNESGLAPADVVFWITFRTVFSLVGYMVFMPHFLRPFFFFLPFLFVGRWLLHMVPAANHVVCGFTETVDTLAALINREYANRVDELANAQDAPIDSQQESDSFTDVGHEEEHAVEASPSSPVALAIEEQWQQLNRHLETNRARQHITLPVALLNQHEPLFVVNRDRLLQHGYDCVVGHCYNQDCLVLVTSERKKAQGGKHGHCTGRDCKCADDDWSCVLF